MNTLQNFRHEEFGSIRVIEIDGEPWFVGKDVADALRYTNSRKALIDHVDAEDRNSVTIRDGIPGNPNKTVINESGLYSLILSSKLPAAKKFKRWVTAEILPSIRRHGAYITPELLEKLSRDREAADSLIRALRKEQARTDHLGQELEDEMAYSSHLEKLVGKYEPKAAYYDLIMQSPGAVQVSLIAKDYGMSAAAFNKLLHSLGVQYKIGATWLLYQTWAGEGYTRSRTYYVGEHTAVIHTCWTQKGRVFLYEFLKGYSILPLSERPGGIRQ